jgi:uncharacterized protein (DUF1778 family)
MIPRSCRTLRIIDVWQAKHNKTIARLEARSSGDLQALLKRAAEIEGRALADFVVSAAREAACRTIEATENKAYRRRRELFRVESSLRMIEKKWTELGREFPGTARRDVRKRKDSSAPWHRRLEDDVSLYELRERCMNCPRQL